MFLFFSSIHFTGQPEGTVGLAVLLLLGIGSAVLRTVTLLHCSYAGLSLFLILYE